VVDVFRNDGSFVVVLGGSLSVPVVHGVRGVGVINVPVEAPDVGRVDRKVMGADDAFWLRQQCRRSRVAWSDLPEPVREAVAQEIVRPRETPPEPDDPHDDCLTP
jgi:hypothetical protein